MFRPHLQEIHLTLEQQAGADRLARDVDLLAGVVGTRHIGRYDMLVAAAQYVRTHLVQTSGRFSEQAYDCWGKTVQNLIRRALT